MVSLVVRGRKECGDLQDSQVHKDPREGQVAKDLKELRVRKAQGEKKGPAENLVPREN